MQIVRLVEPGKVDRIVGFDSLPARLLKGVRRGVMDGFPRHWKTFFKDEPNKERPFYFFEHTMINADKERWQEITSYVRQVVDKKVRLLDKIEDMAIPMAPDSYSQLTVEPEDITIIPIPKEEDGPNDEEKENKDDEEKEDESEAETVSATGKRKPGRPRKTLAAAI